MLDSGTIQIDDGLLHFTVGEGHTFAVDPIEVLRECNAIADRCKGKPEFSDLEELRAWLKTQAGVDLTLGQTDKFWRACITEYRRTQKVFTDALQSLTSTESTPTD